MEKHIDCLLIGHNEMPFQVYEEAVRSTMQNTGFYRNLSLSFINYDNKAHTLADLFNNFNNTGSKLDLGNYFSNTIAYLGTYLHKKGITFDFINAFQSEKEELKEKLENYKIHAIAIPTTFYISVFPILEIVSFVKQYNQDAKIIIGGPFVGNTISMSEENENLLHHLFRYINADFYIDSVQGETTLVNLINAIKNNTPHEQINNIYYKNGRKYAFTAAAAEENKLEDNTVDWTLFSGRLGNMVNVRTSLSCPFSCAFCTFPQRAGKYQTISVEAIEKELNALNDAGVKSVAFVDDTFNVPPERFKDILRMIIRNKYNFKWHSFYRCQFADKETVELMKQSGCEGVFLGIESGNQDMLNNMNKAVTVEKLFRGLELLNEYDITSKASFIIGYLGETQDTVKDTIKFIEEGKPTFYSLHVWDCAKLAPSWDKKDEYSVKGEVFDWSHETMNSTMAFDIVEKMIRTIKNSIYVPDYSFDLSAIINLLHMGYELNQIKSLIRNYDTALKEKLGKREHVEISKEAIEKIRAACQLRGT